MEEVSIRLFPASLPRLFFPCSGEVPLDEGVIASTALDALDAFCPEVLQPRVVVLEMLCVDAWGFRVGPAVFPAERAWRLQEASLPPGMELPGSLPRGRVRSVPTISRETLSQWMADACAQPPTHGADHVSWSLLSVPACRARVLEPEHFLGQEFIEVDSEIGLLKAPLEWRADGLWIPGPLRQLSDKPTVALSMIRDDVGLFLDVEAHWSLWTEQGSAGRAAIDTALSRLMARSWQVEE